MVEETFTRESNNFLDKLLSLKIQKKFCDAVLVVNGDRIPVHMNVLASTSEFFEKEFENVKSESSEITFENVDKETFLQIIDYCYTGTIKFSDDNIRKIIEVAKYLIIPTIIDGCSKILEKMINLKNCFPLLKLIYLENLEDCKKIVLEFLRKEFIEVSNTENFVNLKFSELKDLLSSDIDVPPTVILDAVKKWINKNNESRKENLRELLDLVKLECLPENILLSEAFSLCDADSGCLQKFLKALQLQKNKSSNCKSLGNSSETPFSTSDFNIQHGRHSDDGKDNDKDELDQSKPINSDNTLIAIGGHDYITSHKMEIYDIFNEKWTSVDIPCNKKRFSTIFLDDKLMILGGDCRNEERTKDVQYFHLKTKKIESLAPMPFSGWFIKAVKCEGYVYIIEEDRQDARLYKWDPVKKAWDKVTSLPKPLDYFGAGVINNEIFIVGGKDKNTRDSLNTYAFDSVDKKWRMCKSSKVTFSNPEVVALGDCLYVLNEYTQCEKYDSKTDQWTTFEIFRVYRRNFAAGTFKGQLVIAGGDDREWLSVDTYDEKNKGGNYMAFLNNYKIYFKLIEVPWSLAVQLLPKCNCSYKF